MLNIYMEDVKIFIPKNSRGLSFEIDKQLDARFLQDYGIEDVKLDGDQWQSIFNIIQANQAEQEEGQNTFTEADKDVSNGSQYIVHGDKNYVITGEVWETILGKVKEFLNIEKTEDKKVPAQVTDTTGNTAISDVTQTPKTAAEIMEENKQKISNLISKSYNFEKLPKTLQSDLLRKYALMLDYAEANNQTIDDETIALRLKNYVKGWYYQGKETMVLKNYSVEEVAALKDKSPEDVKYKVYDETDSDEVKEKKINQFVQGYIEYYDINGDGDLDVSESLYADYYSQVKSPKDGINSAKAHQMAYKLYNDYKAGKLVPQKDGTPEEQFLYGIIDTFKYKDLTTQIKEKKLGEVTDNVLNADDIKAWLLTAMEANSKGKKGEIDGSEMIDMYKDMAISDDDSKLYEQFLDNYEKILDSTPDK